MKKRFANLGLILLAALMVLSFTACDDMMEIPEELECEARNTTQDKGYKNFEDAIENANKGDKIELLKDVEIREDKTFSFEGIIDGNDHTISIVEVKEDRGAAPHYGLFYGFAGTIKDLEYHTVYHKSLITYACIETTLDNVDIHGTMTSDESNVAPFVVYPCANSLTLKDCDNYADIYYHEGGNTYGSAFIGYSDKLSDDGSTITFENCNNHAKIQFSGHAGMFFGNPTQISCGRDNSTYDNGVSKRRKNNEIKIDNCHNYGSISAFESVGVISWDNDGYFTEKDDKKALEENETSLEEINEEEGEIINLKEQNTLKTLTVKEDGTFTVRNKEGNVVPEENLKNYNYSVHYNIKFYEDAGLTEEKGEENFNIFFNPAEHKNRFPVAVADTDDPKKDGVIKEDEKNNNVLTLFLCGKDHNTMSNYHKVSEDVKHFYVSDPRTDEKGIDGFAKTDKLSK